MYIFLFKPALILNNVSPPKILCFSVYYVGPDGWKKLSGDDVGELHYKYYPVVPSPVEQEMVEIPVSWELLTSYYYGHVLREEIWLAL